MTNKDMVKKADLREGSRTGEPMPEPNPPAGFEKEFQKDPDYPIIDPLDSNQLKPSLDKKGAFARDRDI